MKIKTVLLFVLIVSCNSIDTSPFLLDGIKSNECIDLGYGVSMAIPLMFEKAKSYNGYQAPNAESSISIKVSQEEIKTYMLKYEPDNLKRSKIKIIEKRPILYNGIEEGYYIVTHNSRKKIITHLALLNNKNKLYKITSFYFESLKEKYEAHIEKAMKTITIGEFVEKNERFNIAAAGKSGSIIYTEDGNYPPETSDSLHMEVVHIENIQRIIPEDYVKSKIFLHTNIETDIQTMLSLSNGKLLSSSATGHNKKAIVFLSIDDKTNVGTCLIFYGNGNINISEVREFGKANLLSYQLK